MDNQNNPNNQNQQNGYPYEQNGYTNFNNYQPANGQYVQPPQAGQPAQQQGQQMPYQPMYQQTPYQQMPYQYNAVGEQKNKSKALGIISIILSVISVCGCSFFSAVPGAILGLIGVIRNKKSVVSWVGLGLGVIASVCWIAYMVYMFTHPDTMRELLESAYGEDFTDQLMQGLEYIVLHRVF